MSGGSLIGTKHDDGHEYVDLGLPSGLLWATCNIGANSPEEAGLYFAWGETTGYVDGAARNAALGLTGGFDQTAYGATGASQISTDLTSQQDAAHAYLGGDWRIPSNTEFQELYDNCTSVWTTENGVNGRRFTSNINGNSIFFPTSGYFNRSGHVDNNRAGFYWSSSFYNAQCAFILLFSFTTLSPFYSDGGRKYGLSIRPVK